MKNIEYLLTLSEASDFLNYSRVWLYRLVAQKRIPHYRRGKLIIFRKDELEKWVQGRETEDLVYKPVITDNDTIESHIKSIKNISGCRDVQLIF